MSFSLNLYSLMLYFQKHSILIKNEDNQDIEHGGAQSNIDNQAIDDIAQDEGLHYVSSMKNDCGSSKEIEENSTPVVESMLEENVHQRTIMEPSNLSDVYSNVSLF